MQTKVRALFISDVHLGTKGTQATYLLDLLERVRCRYLYLVGDIIDLQAMRSRRHWPEEHTAVVRAVLTLVKKGTEVIYVPGNHDAEARLLAGHTIAGVKIMR